MRIVIAGGTGFLGSSLAETYGEEGHDVRVLTRSLKAGESRHDPGTGVPGVTQVGWAPDGQSGPWASAIDGSDVVVNLAGESLDARRWTPRQKTVLRDSRVLPTRSLASAIRGCSSPPRIFISNSAVGYYGPAGDEPKTEDAPAGGDFLARLCEQWEQEARRAEGPDTRVVIMRTGLVFERSGGAFPRMVLPFRFFVGGRLGSGRQYLSWIHRIDWVEMARWIVVNPALTGPVNATAPRPVTNAEFTRAVGHALRRPTAFPVPPIALRLAVGEIAGTLLTGQRAIPARAQAAGFHFRYPEIDVALRELFGER